MTKNKFIFISYVFFLHFFLALILVKSDFIERVETKFNLNNNEITHFYYQMITYQSRVDKNLPANSILFIGDSLTQGLAVSAVTPKGVNYGIGKDTSLGVLNRLTIYNSLDTAEAVVLAIGHNDFKYRSVEETIDNIHKILKYIPKNIKVVLCAVHPIDSNIHNFYVNNHKIKQLNKRIESLSKQYTNVIFLNMEKSLSHNGSLLPKYHIGDGVHLSKKGYDLWIQQLKIAIDYQYSHN
ncbi:MAG: hypothetical protein GY823_11605 [Flavobacteriaceae bacterium]|nr:hypothetical protein [Flavobacteriaceae bacterium]